MKTLLLYAGITGVSLSLGIGAEARAGEPSYKVDRVIPGYSVRQMQAGFPLGSFTAAPEVKVHSTDQARDLLVNESQKRKQEVEGLLKGRSLLPIEGGQEASRPESSPAEEIVSHPSANPRLNEFVRCARFSLPVLKSALSAELRGDLKSAQGIAVGLDQDRGGPAGSGLSCGLYLGRLSLDRPSLREEIKILSVFARRSEANEQKRLLRALYLSHARAVPAEVALISKYEWRRCAPRAALTDAVLPADEVIERELLEGALEGGHELPRPGMELTVQMGDVKRLRAEGESLFEAALTGKERAR